MIFLPTSWGELVAARFRSRFNLALREGAVRLPVSFCHCRKRIFTSLCVHFGRFNGGGFSIRYRMRLGYVERKPKWRAAISARIMSRTVTPRPGREADV